MWPPLHNHLLRLLFRVVSRVATYQPCAASGSLVIIRVYDLLQFCLVIIEVYIKN